jgi:hypothetical protein
MKKKIISGFTAFLAVLSGLVLIGCPTDADSQSTKTLTITGIPNSVTYIIAEVNRAGGAAVLGGNLNTNQSGKVINWNPIRNGSAAMQLYAGAELTAYLAAARKGDTLPPQPGKTEIRGSGRVLVMYADTATNNNPAKSKTWGTDRPLKFINNLTLRWADGKDTSP